MGLGFAAAGVIGGVALFCQGGFAGTGRQGDGPARAGHLGQHGGQPCREVARRIGFLANFDHRRGEANNVNGMHEMGV